MRSKTIIIITALLIAITFIGLTGCIKGGADEVALRQKYETENLINESNDIGKIKEAIKIGIRGKVTSIVNGKAGITILVEGKVENDTIYDKASVTIPKGTIITENKLSTLLDISDIIVGQTAEIVFDGAVAESYLVQGKALTVHLITQTDGSN